MSLTRTVEEIWGKLAWFGAGLLEHWVFCMRPSCLTYAAKHLCLGLSIYFSDRTLVTKRSFQGGKRAKEIACLRLLLFLINRSHYFVLSPCHLSQWHSSTLQLQTAETQVAIGCSIIFLEEGTVKETQGKSYPQPVFSPKPLSALLC